MFASLKSKIIIPIIGILILVVALIIVYASVTTSNLADSLTEERVQVAAGAVTTWLATFENQSEVIALSTSRSGAVGSSLLNWNNHTDRPGSRQVLIEYLNPLAQDMGVDTFVVHDAQGYVVLRMHAPDLYGDSDIALPFVSAALRGEPTVSYASTDTVRMGITATYPVWHEGEIIGSVTASFFMHTEAFVDNVSESFGAEVTVFAGNERVSSTIRDEAGQRAVGTFLDDEYILDEVLGRGQSLMTELTLFGVPFHAYYLPIIGPAGNPIGMFFVGFSNEDTFAATNASLRNTIIIGAVGLVVAAAVMLFLILRSLKPLGRLTEGVKQMAAGNFSVNLNRANLPKDEIGDITQNIYVLADVVKGISQELVTFSQEYTIKGDVEYRIDKDKYQGSYREIVEGINSYADSVSNDIDILFEVFDGVNRGDFAVKIKRLPGKKIVINEKTDELMANLAGINNEMGGMIESIAAKGNVRHRIDESEYQGDWRKIVKGLNDIAAAVEMPIAETRDVLARFSEGHFDKTILGDYPGIFADIKKDVNGLIAIIGEYVREIDVYLGAIAKGDLTNAITREYIGDFAAIKDSINNITGSLYRTMSEISTSSNQVLVGAQQISTSAMDLADGATKQASSIEELNASIEMINEQTRQNADNAGEANVLSSKSTQNAQKGNEAMKEMLEAMLQIKESSNNISGSANNKLLNKLNQMQSAL